MKKYMLIALVFTLLIASALPSFAQDADYPEELKLSNKLKSLGLFLGLSDNNFGLDKEMTRAEGITMLVRLLGKDEEAKNMTKAHPFKDVPQWADGYVTYAYKNGLTNGIAADEFGSNNPLGANMYTTFLLRVLGYEDKANADFTWNEPWKLAQKVGVYTSIVDKDNFLRKDAVNLTVGALYSREKDGEYKLYEKLIKEGKLNAELFVNEFPKDPLFEQRAKESGAEIFNNKDYQEAKAKAENGITIVHERMETEKYFIINGDLTGVMHGPVGYLKVAYNKDTYAGEGTLIQLPLPPRFASGGAVAPEKISFNKELNELTYSYYFEEAIYFDKGGPNERLVREKGTHTYVANLENGVVTHTVK